MTKLSEYIEIAAAEYLHEIGDIELDARWLAQFFQDSGLQEEYPRQNLVEFFNLVQKQLDKDAEKAAKKAHLHVIKIMKSAK